MKVERTVSKETIVGKNEQFLAHWWQRIVHGVDYDCAEQSFPDGEACALVRMRMVPISTRGAVANCEGVVVTLSGLDRLERTAVRLEREMDAVPMNRRCFRQFVTKMDDDVITLAHVECWSRNVAVVRERLGRHMRLQRNSCHRRSEIHFDGVRQLRNVGEEWRIGRFDIDAVPTRRRAHTLV